MTNSEIEKVVVGVDGSPDAKKALAWAQSYAARTGAEVILVTAWQWPTSYGVPLAWDQYDPAVDAQKVLEKAMADLSLPHEQVHPRVVQGPAAEVLARASRDADLLIVGTRGHGSLAGAILGSVSSHCVHHAPCSVVVVR
jgi:nucleotide-binding universal stress UspA family protein